MRSSHSLFGSRSPLIKTPKETRAESSIADVEYRAITREGIPAANLVEEPL